MRAKTVTRVARLGDKFGTGCPACRVIPRVSILGEGDPVPPPRCGTCGRPIGAEVHVFVGIDPGLI